jgi:hypothetical protein
MLFKWWSYISLFSEILQYLNMKVENLENPSILQVIVVSNNLKNIFWLFYFKK